MNLMIQRFRGPEKHGALVEAIRQQQIVGNEKKLAEKLAGVTELIQFEVSPPSNVLIRQDHPENDLFLILVGRVSVAVNGREIAIREAGQHVGEMALIDASAVRCATVSAIQQTVVAKITESDFTSIANKQPILWRRMALEIGRRLRERGKYIKAPNPRPVLFIGSSKESLDPARAVQSLLSHDALARVWTEGFRPSATSIENLERELAASDFAALVLAADDVVKSRKTSRDAPRDNVVWEHGFFTGGLGRGRVFIIKPRNVDLKLPSDWAGITLLDYDPRGTVDDLPSRLGAAATDIRTEIQRLGVK